MPRETATVAILFADIAKSTQIYESLGNKIAQNLIAVCLSHLSNVTLKHKGTIIKTIGDELMCTFPTPYDAVEAAKEMHQTLEEIVIPEKPGYPPPNIYVGIQYGRVVMEKGDVFGDAVNVAARMVSYAKQRQIITTDETIKALPPGHDTMVQCIDSTNIKGKSGKIDIYEIIWEQHDVTVMFDSPDDDSINPLNIQTHLELEYQGKNLVVDQNNPAVTLGRQNHNDIVVQDNPVSRTHARIEYRRGKFLLIDQSSNGSHILIQGKKSVTLKRDEYSLIGYGVIGLGRKVDSDSPFAISYKIKL